jgi:hypothetical protein
LLATQGGVLLDTTLDLSGAGTLLDKSELITSEAIGQLSKFLPRLNAFADWTLAYSSYNDGMSLSAMYRNLARKAKGSSCIMFVRDTKKHVFGVYTNEEWKNKGDKYYGSGESFMFKFKPTLRAYLWSGKNNYFMLGTDTHIMCGGGNGVAGLWMDEALIRGSSGATTTFNNDSLASSPDFKIDGVEVWTFVEPEF